MRYLLPQFISQTPGVSYRVLHNKVLSTYLDVAFDQFCFSSFLWENVLKTLVNGFVYRIF